ncbi:antibiotic biosynthesis monooxygenase [Rhizobium ruizarguesonis]
MKSARALGFATSRHLHHVPGHDLPPLLKTALDVQLLREDREDETWFTTISYWADMESMTAFTKGDPRQVHHLERDAELLCELPERIQIHKIVVQPRLR